MAGRQLEHKTERIGPQRAQPRPPKCTVLPHGFDWLIEHALPGQLAYIEGHPAVILDGALASRAPDAAAG
jgi:hypothetical protein